MDQVDNAISMLAEQLAEVQQEMAVLKAGLMDERWERANTNFEQLSKNVIFLDRRVSVLESDAKS